MARENGGDGYYRPSVSTDIIVFLIRENREESWRHDPGKRLSVLLVKRGVEPFRGAWALPGGFLRGGETLVQCAAREIGEETGVLPRVLMPCGVYDAPDRDPRERVITRAYAGILNGEDIAARGGEDACDAAWFDLVSERDGNEMRITLTRGRQDEDGSRVHPSSVEENEKISCLVELLRTPFGEPDCRIIESGGLAFDHAAILAAALITLRERIESFEHVFEFMPPLFTLTSLQNVMETVCGLSYTPANFRRKVAHYVEETQEFIRGSGHRPARLYKRKTDHEGGDEK